MTGTRPYREAVTVEQAIEELHAHAGTQFDIACVEALVEIVNDAAGEELIGLLEDAMVEEVPLPAPGKARGGRSLRAALATGRGAPVR